MLNILKCYLVSYEDFVYTCMCFGGFLELQDINLHLHRILVYKNTTPLHLHLI